MAPARRCGLGCGCQNLGKFVVSLQGGCTGKCEQQVATRGFVLWPGGKIFTYGVHSRTAALVCFSAVQKAVLIYILLWARLKKCPK